MTPELLQSALARALSRIADARGIQLEQIPRTALRLPKTPGHGDWTSSIALRSAHALQAAPESLATELAGILREHTGVSAADVSGPGFLTITVTAERRAQNAVDIVDAGTGYGPGDDVAATIDTSVNERIASSRALQSLLPDVGPDALRYTAARGASASRQHIESGLLRTAHANNPVYFVQSAHAAACRIERRATAVGIDAADFDPLALTAAPESALLSTLADFLATAGRAASAAEPQRITQFLEVVSQLFLDWSDSCVATPTIDENITRLHASRLVLNRAAIMVLATGLRLLGVCAPERM